LLKLNITGRLPDSFPHRFTVSMSLAMLSNGGYKLKTEIDKQT